MLARTTGTCMAKDALLGSASAYMRRRSSTVHRVFSSWRGSTVHRVLSSWRGRTARPPSAATAAAAAASGTALSMLMYHRCYVMTTSVTHAAAAATATQRAARHTLPTSAKKQPHNRSSSSSSKDTKQEQQLQTTAESSTAAADHTQIQEVATPAENTQQQDQHAIPIFDTPQGMLQDMDRACAHAKQRTASADQQEDEEIIVRNYVGTITNMSREALDEIETDLFPKEALTFYTRFNLNELIKGDPNDERLRALYYTAARGGGQGDYRCAIDEKIENVVSCLSQFPRSKRAVLTIPYADVPSAGADHALDAQAKCLRELHFYIEHNRLHCTGFLRANAVSIFPKNIHFIGSAMHRIAGRLGVKVGSYTHFVTALVAER